MAYKLSHETGITTFAQLVTLVPLALLDGFIMIGKSCFGDSSNCAVNTIFSMFFVIFLGVWFGFVSMLGYAVQERRGRFLAKLLILAELGTAGIALFILQNPGTPLDILGALIAMGLAGWTIVLAFRIHQARGTRIVAKARSGSNHRPRRRLNQ